MPMLDFKNYPNYKRFQNKNILAIDFGTKVIGLASYTPGRDPFPISRGRIINVSEEAYLKELSSIIDEDCIEIIVFGIAYLLDGTATDKTKELKFIFDMLKSKFSDIDFFEQDETLTTKSAEDRMKNSPEYNFKIDPKKIDEVSAIIILEDFIRRF